MNDAKAHIEAILDCPFASKTRFTAAMRWFSQNSVLYAQRLFELGESDPVLLERFLLGYGCWGVSLGSQTPFQELNVPTGVWEQITISKERMLSIVEAAALTKTSLEQLHGVSEASRDVQIQIWRATFGMNLHRTAKLPERIVRDQNVLILGETGSGKELAAQAIMAGKRVSVSRNAAEFPEELFESELFGHVKGAFTGALKDRKGAIEEADTGCLFLDEIADLSTANQVKLLRVLETNEVRKVGGNQSINVDVRYVTATSQPIERLVQEGSFRRDLYERLAGVVVRMPALRDHPEDIEKIGLKILDDWGIDNTHFDRSIVTEFLTSSWAITHDWPGNVRELQGHLRNLLLGNRYGADRVVGTQCASSFPEGLLNATWTEKAVKSWYTFRVLKKHNQNRTRAAEVLQVSRQTIIKTLKESEQ